MLCALSTERFTFRKLKYFKFIIKMIIRLEDELGRIFEFGNGNLVELTIGRGMDNDVDVSAEKKEEKEAVKGVSRNHAVIYPKGRNGTGYSAPSIVDLSSTNGTTVNGRRVYNGEYFLKNEDVIKLGSRYALRVRMDGF
jgi:pSer/pThr/pTyr-binding forkhead associated (FHA) protein